MSVDLSYIIINELILYTVDVHVLNFSSKIIDPPVSGLKITMVLILDKFIYGVKSSEFNTV